MGSRKSDIHVLPPEVMCEITSLLGGREVSRLWVASDPVLRGTLSRGGLQELSYHTVGCTNQEASWPTRLLKQFPRLNAVIISRTRGVANASETRPVTVANIQALPRDLVKLDLSNFYHVLWGRAIHRGSGEVPKMISALPQNLSWLALPEWVLNEEHLSLLPSTLGHLEVHCLLNQHSVSKFSANLETLKVYFKSTTHPLTLSNWPQALHTLEIHSSNDDHNVLGTELENLPPHLTSFTLNAPMTLSSTRLSSLRNTSLTSLRLPKADLVWDIESSERTITLPDNLVAIGFKTCDNQAMEELISALPDNLTYFAIESAQNMTPTNLKALPKSLTSLRIRKAQQISPTYWRHLPPKLTTLVFSNHSEVVRLHLDNLPRSLTSIDTGSMNAEYSSLMRSPSLPPNLRSWSSKSLRTRDQTYGKLLPLIDIREKPTFLRRFGYAISGYTPWKVVFLAFQSFSAYIVYRQAGRILPAIPAGATRLVRKGAFGWMSWVLAFYWALR